MDDEIMELVFENGQILTRGRSRNSSSCFPKEGSVRKKPKLDCQNDQKNNSAAFFGCLFGDDSCYNYNYNEDKHILESQIVPEFNNTPQFHHRQCDDASAPINNGKQSLSSRIVDEYCKPNDNSASLIRQMLHHSQDRTNTPPDEHSEALHLRLNLVKEKTAAASVSVCSSREASNDLSCSSFKTSEETEMMGSANERDQQAPKPAPSRTASKRKPSSQVHSLSERKRRDKLNTKMRKLQALLPISDKVDKVSMLNNAIEYLKTLQLQVQIMSMGTRFWMSQMMLPNGMQQMAPAMGMGVGFGLAGRMPMPMPMPMPPFMPVPPIPVMANSINGSSSLMSSKDNNTQSSVQFSKRDEMKKKMKMKKRMDDSQLS